MTSLIETRIATLERKDDRRLEIRFKPDQRIDMEGIEEILARRRQLCPEGPRTVLAVLPPDVDFDIAVVMKDHYVGLGLENCTTALAFAANSTTNERIAGLYFAYFPQPFATRVCTDEQEATRWLAEQAVARAGS